MGFAKKNLIFLLLAFFALPLLAETSDQEIFALLSDKLKNEKESKLRTMRKVGNKTVRLEAFISAEGDMKHAQQIFSDYSRYSDWVLPNFNVRPSGGTYFFKLHSLQVDPLQKNRLKTTFQFDFPLFHSFMDRDFDLTTSVENSVFLLEGVAVPKPTSNIQSAQGFMKIFQSPKYATHLWIYIQGSAVIRNPILYGLLPDNAMTKQIGERIETVVDNYQKEEAKLRDAKLNQIPIEKMGERSDLSPLPHPK